MADPTASPKSNEKTRRQEYEYNGKGNDDGTHTSPSTVRNKDYAVFKSDHAGPVVSLSTSLHLCKIRVLVVGICVVLLVVVFNFFQCYSSCSGSGSSIYKYGSVTGFGRFGTSIRLRCTSGTSATHNNDNDGPPISTNRIGNKGTASSSSSSSTTVSQKSYVLSTTTPATQYVRQGQGHERTRGNVSGDGNTITRTGNRKGTDRNEIYNENENDNDGRAHDRSQGVTSTDNGHSDNQNSRVTEISNWTVDRVSVPHVRILQEASSNPFSALPYWFQILMIAVLLLISSLFSGLTLGFLGLDITGLEVVIGSDNKQQAEYAAKVLPIRKYGNLLLITLVLGNVAANSLMSILMADKVGGITGFLASTILIVIFAEILPQAACARYALAIGSRTASSVQVVICLFYPVAKPLAMIVDCILGQEILTIYNESEMLKFLQIHVDENAIDKETAATMGGALKYKNLLVKDTMTPIQKVFMISNDDVLDFKLLASIFRSGYSRIPVYQFSKNNIVGLLFVKDLIFLDPDDNVRVGDFIDIFGRQLHVVWYDDKLGDVLRELKQGRSHMALVRTVVTDDVSNPAADPYYTILGIITLEDIIEIILGDDIVDETDFQMVDSTSHDMNTNNGDADVQLDDDDDDVDKKSTTLSTSILPTTTAGHGSADADPNRGNYNRKFDWGRLRSLDAKIVDETLTDDEVRAIVAHLQKNYSTVVSLINETQLHRLVSESRVVIYDPPETLAVSAPTSLTSTSISPTHQLLYTKGVPTNRSLLLLSGKVTIVVGDSNFHTDVSSWYMLCPRAVQVSSYVPDFSAYVSGENKCRCLQITKAKYDLAVDASSFERIGRHPTFAISSSSTDVVEAIPQTETEFSQKAVDTTTAITTATISPADTEQREQQDGMSNNNVLVDHPNTEPEDDWSIISKKLMLTGVEAKSTKKTTSTLSSSGDGRTSIQKFQDALLLTSLDEDYNSNIRTSAKQEELTLDGTNQESQKMKGTNDDETTVATEEVAFSYDAEVQNAKSNAVLSSAGEDGTQLNDTTLGATSIDAREEDGQKQPFVTDESAV